MQRRAILQVSSRHGIDRYCGTRHTPRAFFSAPVYVFRRTLHSSLVTWNSAESPSPADDGEDASVAQPTSSPPRFGNRWGGGPAQKQAGLSLAEKAARDSLVQKQSREEQQKAQEQPTWRDRTERGAQHFLRRARGGQGHGSSRDRKSTVIKKGAHNDSGAGKNREGQRARIRYTYSSPTAGTQRDPQVRGGQRDAGQSNGAPADRRNEYRSSQPGGRSEVNHAHSPGSRRASDWSCPECGYQCFGRHGFCPVCKSRKPSQRTDNRGTERRKGAGAASQVAVDTKMDTLRQSVLADLNKAPGVGLPVDQMLSDKQNQEQVSVGAEASRDRFPGRRSVWKSPGYEKPETPEFDAGDQVTSDTERPQLMREEPGAYERDARSKGGNREVYEGARTREGHQNREGRKAREFTDRRAQESGLKGGQRSWPADRKAPKNRENRRQQMSDEGDDFDREEYQRRRQQRKQIKREKAMKKERKKEMEQGPSPLYLPAFISVINLADVIGVRPGQFIRRMERMGFEDVTYDHILDAETAGLVAAEFNFEPIFDTLDEDLAPAPEPEDKSALPPRPPVVTIMGHVDHGKTTILDWLRKSSVAASEHGGITQHIGAFSVTMPSGKMITFLDTPGHEAFLDMRRRGADVTDIVVLVVAADDSVKPQTIEAIKHATASKVPIIVAMSKIDKPGVNSEKVKQDLSMQSIHVEDYGGDVQAIGVSGKTGQGMVELEEAIITLSEILDYRADDTGNVEGWVIEAGTKSHGRVATVLVRRGTLRPGDIIVAGTTWARVRTLRNEAGATVEEATPGTPVEVDGWREQPTAGTEILQAPDEQKAKDVVEIRQEKSETAKLGKDTAAMNQARRTVLEKRRREDAGIESEADQEQTGPKKVNFIIKADVGGSAEAVMNSVTAIGTNEVYANVLRSAVGQVSESDIEHAASSGGHLISFNMPVDPNMGRMAERLGVNIMDHNVIYKLVDSVKDILSDQLPPSVSHRVTGEAEISQIFEINVKRKDKMAIAGCKVRNGVISTARKVRVFRGQEVVYDGTITSLKNVKKDVTEMRKDSECGMGFADWTGFQPGDHVQCYEELYEKRRL